MRLTLWYDKTLLEKFNGNDWKVKKELEAVVENTKKKYLQSPTLIIKINPVIDSIRHVNKIIYIDENTLVERSGVNCCSSLNCYFVENYERPAGGVAQGPMPCPAVNINFHGNLTHATNIFAHEFGHNLDMT